MISTARSALRVKVPYLISRGGAWYWQPAGRLRRALGVKGVALGRDAAAALRHAQRLNAELAARRRDPAAPLPFSVAWLFQQFRDSPGFDRLAPSTIRDYTRLMDLLASHALEDGRCLGDIDAAAVKPRHADVIHRRLADKHGEAWAQYACRVARRAWSWGARAEHVTANPWAKMRLPGLPAREQVWTPAQIEAFRAAAIAAGRPSLALAALLSYETTQRQGDVLRLTWRALEGGTLRLRQRKTGRVVEIPVATYPRLAAAIEAAPRDALTIVSDETTRGPYAADRFRRLFRRIADAAGIPASLEFRDLRATGATELADAGADVIGISSHTGHATMEMARRYARRTGRQAERAAAARVAARTNLAQESETKIAESESR